MFAPAPGITRNKDGKLAVKQEETNKTQKLPA